jgi:hypothetical protein
MSEYFHSRKAINSEQLTVTSAVKQLTAAEYNNSGVSALDSAYRGDYQGPAGLKASAALIQVLSDDVYYTFDGSTPSSSNGRRAFAGDTIVVAGHQKLRDFKAIRVTTDATLNVEYYA